jgi:hypothetical protein
MPPITDEMLNEKIGMRLLENLEQQKNLLGPLDRQRLSRYLPLVDNMVQDKYLKESLCFLLDSFLKKRI